jgi:2-aminoadipate transaminase
MLNALRRHLPPGALTCRPVAGGLYLWCRLGSGVNSEDLLRAALDQGVAFAAGHLFYPDGAGHDEIRLCFSAASPDQIDEGVRRLAAALRGCRRSSPIGGPAMAAR